MSDKPTGVFVRLPLSNEQLGKLIAPTRPLNERLLAIGTPVAGGTFEIVGWVAPELFTHFGKIPTGTVISSVMTDSRTLPLVRQSDAQAQIAARNAEILRLRKAITVIDSLIMGNSDPVAMFCGIHSECIKALKGGAA